MLLCESSPLPTCVKLTTPVCPGCSNLLRVDKVPPGDPSTEQYVGQNRFVCLTCPYQYIIDKQYYERKTIKKKEVEDIIGGKHAWDNVDKTSGLYYCCQPDKERLIDNNSAMPEREVQERRGILLSATDTQR